MSGSPPRRRSSSRRRQGDGRSPPLDLRRGLYGLRHARARHEPRRQALLGRAPGPRHRKRRFAGRVRLFHGAQGPRQAAGLRSAARGPDEHGEDKVSMSFFLPSRRRLRPRGALSIEIEDPTFFVYFSLSDGQAAVSLADAPQGCVTASPRPSRSMPPCSRSCRTKARSRRRISAWNIPTGPSSHVPDIGPPLPLRAPLGPALAAAGIMLAAVADHRPGDGADRPVARP